MGRLVRYLKENLGPGLLRNCAALLLTASLLACSDPEIPPWTDAELDKIEATLVELGEGYAVLDICMPILEEDEDAKGELINVIKADRYTKLQQMDTEYELEKIFAYFAKRGGSPEQNAYMREVYYEAYAAAVEEITSIDVCVQTIKDYANTLIYMKVGYTI